jgi:hypothetical protein
MPTSARRPINGQTPHQEALGTTDLGQGSSQCCQIETPVRPVVGLPDIFAIAAIHAEIMGRILRMRHLFTAQNAVIEAGIRRNAAVLDAA